MLPEQSRLERKLLALRTPDDQPTAVYKYELRPWSIFIDIHRHAQILSAGAQGPNIVIWAKVLTNQPKVSRRVAAYPTGSKLPAIVTGDLFVDTVQMPTGLVFHVFDGGEV